jgi:periplasmic divalent cation tolerance protein
VKDVAVVFVTAPAPETLEAIGRTLIEERRIACANVFSGLTSIYRWEDSIEEAPEALAMLKTTTGQLETLERRIAELHPYDVPEVLVVGVERGTEAYLDWVRSCCGGPTAG